MCCNTHDERDRRDRAAGVEFQVAEREEFRCRCAYGNPCRRRMSYREDFMCEWCSDQGENGHVTKCEEFGSSYGSGEIYAGNYDSITTAMQRGVRYERGPDPEPWKLVINQESFRYEVSNATPDYDQVRRYYDQLIQRQSLDTPDK